jgi:hypothetical protein
LERLSDLNLLSLLALPVFFKLHAVELFLLWGESFQLFAVTSVVVELVTDSALSGIVLFISEALKFMVPTSGTL